MLRIDPQDSVPIWKQIEEGVRHLVASGALVPEAAVPSVRELARELRVNPLTVQKAYRGLADAGVLEVRRGAGTFVAAEPPPLSDAERRDKLHTGAMRYASLAHTLGAKVEESLDVLRHAWDELEEES